MEAVLSQAEKASKEAVRLVEKFRAVSKLPESKLKELGQQIDVAVNQANELFKLIHGFGQGPNGGLVGNGILWPDNVPARFKYLNDMADKSKYMNYSTAMTLMDNYDTEMAKLVQYSREMEKVTVEHLEWLKKNAARDAARGIKSANSLELEAARIESRILPRTASSGAVAAGHAPSLWQATKTFLRSAVR